MSDKGQEPVDQAPPPPYTQQFTYPQQTAYVVQPGYSNPNYAYSQPTTTNVITPTTVPRYEHVEDNMVLSVISIFCCLILGVVATIKASEVKDKVRMGNVPSARESAALAKKLAIAAIFIGAVVTITSVTLSVVLPWIYLQDLPDVNVDLDYNDI